MPRTGRDDMKSHIGWLIIICFFAALIAGFFILKEKSSGAPLDMPLATTTFASETEIPSPDLPAPNVPEGYKEYRNEQFGISMYYPAEIPPQEFVDRGPELTVLFQGGEGEPGFQIYVAPIDGTKISPERFVRDAPSGIMQEPRDTTIDGVPAVTFYGFDARVGKTSEMWFIKDHFLYEVSTYKELSGWLSEIMQTWRFVPRTSGI